MDGIATGMGAMGLAFIKVDDQHTIFFDRREEWERKSIRLELLKGEYSFLKAFDDAETLAVAELTFSEEKLDTSDGLISVTSTSNFFRNCGAKTYQRFQRYLALEWGKKRLEESPSPLQIEFFGSNQEMEGWMRQYQHD